MERLQCSFNIEFEYAWSYYKIPDGKSNVIHQIVLVQRVSPTMQLIDLMRTDLVKLAISKLLPSYVNYPEST